MQPPAYSSLPDKKIDKISLRGAALPDPDHPFLISPLPQFTTPLTTSTNFLPTPAGVPPLPELTDDLEDDEDDDEAADSDSEHEATTPIVVQQDLRGSNGIRRLSFLQTDGRSEYDSALARSGPYLDHRRARSGSTPEMYTSPSVNISADTSKASPRSPPKSATLSQSQQQQQVQQHASSSSREGDASSFPTRSTPSRNPDGGVLRTRLHDLLRDSPISSSLPNMSASHFPASFTNRETSSGSVSPLPPPRSDSSNTNKTPLPPLPSSSSSDTAVPLLPQTTGGSGKPLSGVANFAPRQGFSSASTEAKKLEEERRRKLIEEKQQQQNSMDHTMSKQPSTSTSTIQTSNSNNNNTSNSGLTPTTRRGQSFTGSFGRSGTSMASPSKEDQHDTVSSSSSNSSSTSSSLPTTARRGQSFTGSLGRSGSSTAVSPTKEEHQQQQQHDTFMHQARYVSIGKTRGTILSSSIDSAGIYA